MSTQIGEIDGYHGGVIVTEFAGNSVLAGIPGNKDRMCLQVGDALQLDRKEATQLRDMLSKWLGDEQHPLVGTQPRLVLLPWGESVAPDSVDGVVIDGERNKVIVLVGERAIGSFKCSGEMETFALVKECTNIINGLPK